MIDRPNEITKRDRIGALVFVQLQKQPDKKKQIVHELAEAYSLSVFTIRNYYAHWLKGWKALSSADQGRILRTLQ